MSQHTTSEARESFSDIINRAAYGKERVVLTRRGKRVVAVVPVEDLEIHSVLMLLDAGSGPDGGGLGWYGKLFCQP